MPGVGSGPDQLPGIGLQELDPALGVELPMAGPVAESDPDAGHQGRDLGPELFAGGRGRVGPVPKGGGEDRAVQPVRVAGPVAEFVQEGLIIALCAGESVLRRQDDPVLSQAVAGLVAGFVATAHAAGLEHALDPFVDRPGRRGPVVAQREEQALNLHDVEKDAPALFGAVRRRRALRRRGIKIPGREDWGRPSGSWKSGPRRLRSGSGCPSGDPSILRRRPSREDAVPGPRRRAAGRGSARARSGARRAGVVARGPGGCGVGRGPAGGRTPGPGGVRGVEVGGARA